jgi:hypothetical protein
MVFLSTEEEPALTAREARTNHHPYQVVAQCVEIYLVPQLLREGFEGLDRIVLTAVEPLIYERLDASPQRDE